MTHVLIDRATLEQLVEYVESVPDDRLLVEWLDRENLVSAGRAALANAEPTECLWSKDPDFEMGDTYDSSCGEKWSFIDGGPAENSVRFCQGCGKPVKLIKEPK